MRLLALLLLAGCTDPGNAARLWIAPGASDGELKLQSSEPHPF